MVDSIVMRGICACPRRLWAGCRKICAAWLAVPYCGWI